MVYVYGVLNEAGESKKWESFGIKEGDIITLEGTRGEFNGTPQMKNGTLKKHVPVTAISAADFNALPDDNNTYYMLSGTVSKIVKADYGNIYIKDATGEAYIYGVLDGIEGAKKNFASLGVKEGDNITVVTIKTSYKDSPQGSNAWFISKNDAAE